MQETLPIQSPGVIFKRRTILWLAGAFVVIVGLANVLSMVAARAVIQVFGSEIDRPRAWPMSIFAPRLPYPLEILAAAGATLLFWLVYRYVARGRFRLEQVLGAGLLLILASNLVQGWENGFVTPVAGTWADWRDPLLDPTQFGRVFTPEEQAERARPVQYLDDARAIERGLTARSASDFLQRFNEIQPTRSLRMHSKTHPPGAVLTFYALDQLFTGPAMMAMVIATVAAVLSGVFFHGVLRTLGVEPALSRYATLLYLLLPAVQIYYAASLDALIGAAMLGALYFFLQPRWPKAVFGTISLVTAASFLTFAWLLLVPVMAGWEIVRRRNIWRTAAVCAAVAAFYVGLRQLSGFDYIEAFRTASRIENPEGFRLLAAPASYVFTRLEGIGEILLFFGPFLLVLMWRGLRRPARGSSPLHLLFWLATGTLLAMLAAGAYRTGETARAAMYVYPYLLLPVVGWLGRTEIPRTGGWQLAALVFAQGLLMQLFGSYFW